MNGQLSGREMAIHNLERFKGWVIERDAAGDWQDYIRGDKLNRSEIAAECCFALSVVRQNPAVKDALAALETRLLAAGVLGAAKADQRSSNAVSEDAASLAVSEDATSLAVSEDATRLADDRRIMAAKGKAEQRVKTLEEQNATLRAEVGNLHQQLIRYKHLEEHLCKTGRLLYP